MDAQNIENILIDLYNKKLREIRKGVPSLHVKIIGNKLGQIKGIGSIEVIELHFVNNTYVLYFIDQNGLVHWYVGVEVVQFLVKIMMCVGKSGKQYVDDMLAKLNERIDDELAACAENPLIADSIGIGDKNYGICTEKSGNKINYSSSSCIASGNFSVSAGKQSFSAIASCLLNHLTQTQPILSSSPIHFTSEIILITTISGPPDFNSTTSPILKFIMLSPP